MAGIIGLRAEDMEQVDALKRARLDYPNGLPMIRPHVRALALVADGDDLKAVPARFGFSRKFPSLNARIEKLTTSPLWRSMFGKSHAILPISYVIEWVTKGEEKTPYLIQRRDRKLIMAPALVGKYHENPEETAFAICTREPNQFFALFHDRMVGHCTPEAMERWLHPSTASKDDLMDCIGAPADDELEAVPTSPAITKRKAGDWSALEPVGRPLRWEDLKAT